MPHLMMGDVAKASLLGKVLDEAPMSCRRAMGSKCRRIIVTLASLAILGVAAWYVVLWVPGLPGPHHGAYLALASLYNIRGGLLSYDELNGHLPPATATDAESGEPSSWRIEVYRSDVREGFITAPKTSDNVSIDYDSHKAWNDPDNLRLQGLGWWLFSYTQTGWGSKGRKGKAGKFATYYKAITGPGTAFDFTKPPSSMRELPNDVILVVRVEQSDTHWMEPGDLNIEELGPSDETRALLLGKDGYIVLFADGQRWVLSRKTPISDLCKFFTVARARQFDREEILGPYRVLP